MHTSQTPGYSSHSPRSRVSDCTQCGARLCTHERVFAGSFCSARCHTEWQAQHEAEHAAELADGPHTTWCVVAHYAKGRAIHSTFRTRQGADLAREGLRFVLVRGRRVKVVRTTVASVSTPVFRAADYMMTAAERAAVLGSEAQS